MVHRGKGFQIADLALSSLIVEVVLPASQPHLPAQKTPDPKYRTAAINVPLLSDGIDGRYP